jgi:hypothetical protein
MGDHFWPALYPGLIVGLLFGLSARGFWNVALALTGSLIGSAIAVTALFDGGLNDGLISVATTIAGAAFGAYAFLYLGRKLSSSR